MYLFSNRYFGLGESLPVGGRNIVWWADIQIPHHFVATIVITVSRQLPSSWCFVAIWAHM